MDDKTSENIQFSLEKFESLENDELHDYTESIAWKKKIIIREGDLRLIASRLSAREYEDEYHIVYAIVIGMFNNPELFKNVIPQYLSHEKQSVRLAVHRHLLWMTPELISSDLIIACQKAIKLLPLQNDVSDLVDKLIKKIE